MTEKFDVLVYFRNSFVYEAESMAVILDVVIPEKHVWEFVDEFRKSFGTYDSVLGSHIKAVDGYDKYSEDGWHIKLIIWENTEGKFYDFLRKFCEERKLKLLKPEAEQEEE